MKKTKLIFLEIKKHRAEIIRLQTLLIEVDGDTLEHCPQCKTKNYHWSTDGKWCCAFC
jgi:uncharacterized Zn finger protein (UPF0148 family)